jgi:hypothetical protein
MPQGGTSQMNMRNVMSILRRTTSATRLRAGPNKTLASQGSSSASIPELGAPIGSSTSMYSIDEEEAADTPPVDVRAQFKKQMLEKELESCIRQKRLSFKLDELKETSVKLIGEQKELLAERERCIAHDLSHGLMKQEGYYMDERLDCIDYENALIKSRVSELECQLSVAESASEDREDAFENAENILKSLDVQEIQVVSGLLMKETVELRVESIDKDIKLGEKEKMLLELRAVLETVRAVALRTSMGFEKRILEIQGDARRVLESAVNVSPEKALFQSSESPVSGKSGVSTPQLLSSPSRLTVKSKSMFVVPTSLSPTPLPEIDLARGVWEEHGSDPAIVAQHVVNRAIAAIPDVKVEDREGKKTLEEMNASLKGRKEKGSVGRRGSRRRPPRPASAPIPPILNPVRNVGRSPSPVMNVFPLRRSPSPVLVRPIVKGKRGSGVGDDAIWQDALKSMSSMVSEEKDVDVDKEMGVFERLSKKHTISSFLRKG